ncbi:MAG TPA: hypothetical protein VI636_01840 [Candidatus Angelobacter sp.]
MNTNKRESQKQVLQHSFVSSLFSPCPEPALRSCDFFVFREKAMLKITHCHVKKSQILKKPQPLSGANVWQAFAFDFVFVFGFFNDVILLFSVPQCLRGGFGFALVPTSQGLRS